MLAILTDAKLIIAGGVAVALFAVGYAFGARKVNALEVQLADIRKEEDFAAKKLKQSQDEIAKVIQEKNSLYALEVERMKSEWNQKEQELSTALAGANKSVASLKVELRGADARRAKLVAEMGASSSAERVKLQQQIDAIDGERRTLTDKVDANLCLTMAIPDPIIAPFLANK
jgi:chromosome segregation ATPase